MERLKIKSLKKRDQRLIRDVNDLLIGSMEIMKDLTAEHGKAHRKLFEVLRACFQQELKGKKIVRYDLKRNELIICDEIEEETKGD